MPGPVLGAERKSVYKDTVPAPGVQASRRIHFSHGHTNERATPSGPVLGRRQVLAP